MFGLVVATTLAANAAERASSGGAQWPNLSQDEEAKWPNLRLDDIEAPRVNKHPSFVDPQEVEDRIMGRKPRVAAKPSAAPKQTPAPDVETTNGIDDNASAAHWPNLRLDDVEAPRVNKHPSFVDPQEVESRIMGRKPNAAAKPSAASKQTPAAVETASGLDANASAARWPTIPSEKRVSPSPFAFEAGMRYWYSTGSLNFAFANGSPLFGNPTSTLDWRGLSAHSGEAFARIDHIPSGVFVKGLFGLGSVTDGHIDDRDFLFTQYKFSDTTSDIHNGNLSYAMLDVGWAYTPTPGVRLGFFAGYHYWHEKVTAYGIICNVPSFLGCPAAGVVVEPYSTAVLSYEPTVHAARIGFEGRVAVDERWSFSGEIAGVPFAALRNKDSHLLRQDMSDLGPAPNVITTSTYAFGVEAELFVNYAITPNIEVGTGVRYWGVTANKGDVRFGPDFGVADPLNKFDQQRYGVLAHVKGKF
jgi:outer membrane protease